MVYVSAGSRKSVVVLIDVFVRPRAALPALTGDGGQA
jgi:hypothetical protein